MANRRMINKDDFESLEYGALTIKQRYLFQGVMLYADDDGIIPVRLVRGRVFPYDEDITFDEVNKDLIALQTYGFLILYEHNEYIEVQGWRSRQQLRKERYKATKYPLPPSYEPAVFESNKKNGRTLDNPRVTQSRVVETSTVKVKVDESNLDENSVGQEVYIHTDGRQHPYPESVL